MRGRSLIWLALALAGVAGAALGIWTWRTLSVAAGSLRSAAAVVDEAGVIDPESEAQLNTLAGALLDDLEIELATVVVPDLGGESIAAAASRRLEEDRIGSRTPTRGGLLLLIAAAEERVRLEVGYSLEDVLTDAFISYVESEQMVPYFEDGLIGDGVEATVELIAARLFDAAGTGAWDPGARTAATGHGAGGAGAERAVPLTGGRGSDRSPADDDTRRRFGPQPTPEAAWEAFLKIQRRRIKDPGLGIYDRAAADILRTRTTSDAGQRHLARLYEGVAYEVRVEGGRAAVVFPDDPKLLLAPWFFHRDARGWRLDGSMYPGVIGYNHLNQWRFKRRDHPYTFAFTDYSIDRYGFATRVAP